MANDCMYGIGLCPHGIGGCGCHKVKAATHPTGKASAGEFDQLLASPYCSKILKKHIAALQETVRAYEEALKVYANKDEWYGAPWKLTFNSSHMDGDGWETAAMILRAHRAANEMQTLESQSERR